MNPPKAISGRARRHTTRWTVKWGDRLARTLIALGGIGTIIAVCTVFIFLISVAAWLFAPAAIGEPRFVPLAWGTSEPGHMAVDEYRTTGWSLFPDAMLEAFRLDNGQVLKRQLLADDEAKLTAYSFAIDGEHGVFGFSDGSVRLGRVGFDTRFVDLEDVPESVRNTEVGEVAQLDDSIATRISESQFRVQKFVVELQERIKPVKDSPIVLIDFTERSSGPIYCALTADGTFLFQSVHRRVNVLTDEVIVTTTGGQMPLAESARGAPSFLLLAGLGDNLYVAWKDGRLVRFDIRDLANPHQAEEVDIVPEENATLTQLQFMLGRGTLLAGDSLGRVRTWFGTRPDANSDQIVLVNSHEMEGNGSPVTALGMSSRLRMFAAGYGDGTSRLFYVTSEKLLTELKAEGEGAVTMLALSPKSDALYAATRAGITQVDFDLRHPETTAASLFGKVSYEGFDEPAHVWQSSSGQDAFEKKLGLMPLVFGTIKATFYSMLFGAPLALLAAIYTSEFLHPRLKSKIKPTIEMMASLPSVVLGFLAGIFFAPLVENIVPEVLMSIITIPLSFVLGAYLFQLLPPSWTLRIGRAKILLILLCLPIGVLAAKLLGPPMESLLFHGDIKSWLSGHIGGATGGWMLLFLPLSAVAVTIIMGSQVNPWMRRVTADWPRQACALADLAKFVCGVVVALVVALAISLLLDSLRLDPRGSYVDTYVPRNAMILGFFMGFAIIPIIYTIAEDALSTVPEHLRSASLGAGATPWQTAVRIIIPVAMSGLFSAMMIGLGRAVGETMIVLMAAGNTPIMEWNIFNGFQTLSAAIATELGEAPVGSTHYRTLFLAALTLFVMTFFVNTIAEMVRLRFRRRAYEL